MSTLIFRMDFPALPLEEVPPKVSFGAFDFLRFMDTSGLELRRIAPINSSVAIVAPPYRPSGLRRPTQASLTC